MSATVPCRRPLWLASRSPRRRKMLRDAGVPIRIRPPGFDDGDLVPGRVAAASWVMALAYLKGRWVADAIRAEGEAARGTVLAADTVCILGGRILGQPGGAADAREMLHAIRDETHETATGVCLLSLGSGDRCLFVDRATVRCGGVSTAEIDRYLRSGQWRGKAGGYNLEDRRRAGWPIEVDGDPATVMGLPMRRLEAWLAGLAGAAP